MTKQKNRNKMIPRFYTGSDENFIVEVTLGLFYHPFKHLNFKNFVFSMTTYLVL